MNAFLYLLGIHTYHAGQVTQWYQFWSGFGSDVGEFALLGALWAAYRKHVCHVHRCWRIQRHQVDGTPFVVCRRHHPTAPAKVKPEHLEAP